MLVIFEKHRYNNLFLFYATDFDLFHNAKHNVKLFVFIHNECDLVDLVMKFPDGMVTGNATGRHVIVINLLELCFGLMI